MFYNHQNKFSNKFIKQTTSLLSVNFLTIPLGFILSVLLTKILKENAYGNFIFIQNIFNIAITLGNLGLFYSGNRTILITKEATKIKELYGAELVLVGILSILLILALFTYGVLDKNLEAKGIKSLFLSLVPFISIFLMTSYFENLFPADNNISLLNKSRLLPKLLNVLLVFVLYYLNIRDANSKVIIVWISLLLSQGLIIFYVIIMLQPSIGNLKQRIKDILRMNKIYGLNLYLGSLFAVGSSYLTVILIGYSNADNIGVGHYSLALTFSLPLSLIPNAIATVKYRDFPLYNKIPSYLLLITVIVSIFSLVIMQLVVPFVITIFYGESFREVISLSAIISFGVVLYSLGDFLNRFLGSHGQGKQIRNSALLVSIILLLLNITIVPRYGETGAAYTYLLAGGTYLMNMIYYYIKLDVNKTEHQKLQQQFSK